MKFFKLFNNYFWHVIFWIAITYLLLDATNLYDLTDVEQAQHSIIASISLAMVDIKRWLGITNDNPESTV